MGRTARLKYKEQFAMLEGYISVMGRGLINSIIVYGRAGLGKSEVVKQSLEKHNLKYTFYSGGLKGSYELAKVLYKHRKSSIIVFDDFDSAFRTRSQVNLLMTALQDQEEKQISWVDTTKKKKEDSIPERFTFTSGVIFITNKLRIDNALKSRSKVIRIELTNREVIERISDVIESFLPKVPKEFKLEVLKWLKANVTKIKRMDFRVFKYCVANYLMDKDQNIKDGRWKRWSLREINS